MAHFDRLSEVPDAVARLRRFVLDLAVRGRLVPQHADEESAVGLLERISAEKERLVEAGEIRRETPSLTVTPEQLPFDLPTGWAWTRLGEVIHLVSGQHLQPTEYSEEPSGGLPYVTGPSDFSSNGLHVTRFALVRKAVAKRGQLLLTVKGSGVGKSATCDIPEVAISRQLMALTAIGWNPRFLTIQTHLLAETLQAQVRSLIPGISREDVERFVVAMPSLHEQHRIVAKVDELMALCDQLEAAEKEREEWRDRLAAASLGRLNGPAEREEFRERARFCIAGLHRATTRAKQVKSLRRSVLGLAVRGRLTTQDPNDEPAAELLRRIAKEDRLATKLTGSLSEASELAIYGEAPLGWEVVPLGCLGAWAIGAGFPKGLSEILCNRRRASPGKSLYNWRNDPWQSTRTFSTAC